MSADPAKLIHPGIRRVDRRDEPGESEDELRAAGCGEDLISGVAFLSHGRLEAAHRIAQARGGAAGCYLHGMMHRLEGDLPNARYWFGRSRAEGDDAIRRAVAARLADDPDAAAVHEGFCDRATFDPGAWTAHLESGNRDADAEHRVIAAESEALIETEG